MHAGARAICLLMALLAALTELVSAAFGQEQAQPAALPNMPVNEVAAEQAAPVQNVAATPAAKAQNFSMSPLEMRIMAYAPRLRVIGSSQADSRQMASLADANERQLLFVKTTLG
jgi:hypothetical protein